MDFEEAMASAWMEVFPNCSIMRDLFHLQQVNSKKLHKIGLSDFRKEVGHDIRVVWYADSSDEFHARLRQFLSKWDEKAPEYTDYFWRVWIKQHPPNKWAAFARGKDAPSGMCVFVCVIFA
jgi:Transposase